MKGFNAKFVDFPDYILGITHEIWEERGVDTLHHYYTPDIVVRSPASVVIGNKAVIDATQATLAEFPDRQLLGEDVIWSGDPDAGMLSSHRILSTATHSGDGAYGKATGRRLAYRVIADCHAINDQINDEWLIRDQGAIIRQMGWDVVGHTRDAIRRGGGPDTCAPVFLPEHDRPGPYQGRGNDNEWGGRLADILTRIMDNPDANIHAGYDRAVQAEYAGGIRANGWQACISFWAGLRQAFPSAQFAIDHQIGRDDPQMPPRAAIRWAMRGKHDGAGMFGPATGADVYIMGATHAEFGALVTSKTRLRREWTLFDETAVWRQILMHTGDV
jgi:predicted ester cyclase